MTKKLSFSRKASNITCITSQKTGLKKLAMEAETDISLLPIPDQEPARHQIAKKNIKTGWKPPNW
jgi:hypothetical protein